MQPIGWDGIRGVSILLACLFDRFSGSLNSDSSFRIPNWSFPESGTLFFRFWSLGFGTWPWILIFPAILKVAAGPRLTRAPMKQAHAYFIFAATCVPHAFATLCLTVTHLAYCRGSGGSLHRSRLDTNSGMAAAPKTCRINVFVPKKHHRKILLDSFTPLAGSVRKIWLFDIVWFFQIFM